MVHSLCRDPKFFTNETFGPPIHPFTPFSAVNKILTTFRDTGSGLCCCNTQF